MYGEISSEPTTSAVRATPVRIIAVAVDSPYRKLVQAVLTSIAAQPLAPSRACRPDAMFGAWSSWLVVPNTIRSSVRPSMPAQARARIAAT